ncbi:MAG: hypothetical protein V4503_05825 [Gemmatimonadota bacterium]
MAVWTRRKPSDRRGITLLLSLFALVILGATVAAAFMVVRFDRSASSSNAYAGDAQNAAEAGLADVYATWDPTVQGALAVWTPSAPVSWTGGTRTLQSGKLFYESTVRRLNSQLFLVEATGWRGTTTRRASTLTLSQWFRLVKPTIGVNAAVTVNDPVKFNGNSFLVSGINALPPQWAAGECTAISAGNEDDVVGVRSATGTGVTAQDANNVFGFPTRDAPNDPSVTSETFTNFVDYTFATLGSQPGVKVLPNTTPYNGVGPVLDAGTGTCDKSVLLNLGEPYRPPSGGIVTQCTGYYPVVHGTGAQTKFAANSRGQGTLLIDGDLELVGGFEWDGLIIVRNQIKVTGNGNKLYGAVLAAGADVATTNGSVGGNVTINYSECAITKAVNGASLARPLGQRAWAQSY